MSEVRAVFVLMPSARCLAAATSRPFLERLQTKGKCKCQRLLTVGFEARGSVLEGLERRVCLERPSHRFCASWTNIVGPETANEGKIGLSAAADTLSESEHMGAPDGLQGGIHLEHLGDCDNAYSSIGASAHRVEPTELVAVQAASEGADRQQALSAAADSRKMRVRRRT